MIVWRYQFATQRKFKQRDAFLRRAARDADEPSSVGFRKPAISLGNIGSDRQRGTIELIHEEPVTARKLLGRGTNLVGKIDRLLVDEQFLEIERHWSGLKYERVVSRKEST
jgi:hypothetical protein